MTPTTENDLSKGDLIFVDYDNNGKMDHVMTYIGDNKVITTWGSDPEVFNTNWRGDTREMELGDYINFHEKKFGNSTYEYKKIDWPKLLP
jgi:cell wall-associated NlpC family hydrolase